jgi:hypothetical protein
MAAVIEVENISKRFFFGETQSDNVSRRDDRARKGADGRPQQ